MWQYNRTKEVLREWAVRHAQGPYAAPFLFVLAYVEAFFLPVPVETALVPLVLIKARSWFFYAAIATLGSLLGGITGYFIGLLFYEALGAMLVNLYSFEEEIAYIRDILTEHVFWATFIAAFTPLPDKVFMPIAGLLKAPFLLFAAALFLGRSLRFLLVAFVTERFGALATRLVLKYIGEITLVAVAVFAVFLLWWLLQPF